jgi:predicted signal transduction protein with EAL and GGDEF domain
VVDDLTLEVDASIGVAIFPDHGADTETLLQRADIAMYSAKSSSGGSMLFEASQDRHSPRRLALAGELRSAISNGQIVLYFQPKADLRTGQIVGVEALARWEHPSHGSIPPTVFVAVAEEAGLMDQLGAFVLRKALADATRWPNLYVSVNLSPVQVRDSRFADLLSEVLAETKIEPDRVMLEVTEGVLIDDTDGVKTRLDALRALGVKLALDDFGAGYSSLAYLQRLPFDKLKIDRGFVAALDKSANAGVIIQAIVALGRALGLGVVIEGVETEEQRVLLRLAGCSEMQGYLFAKPAPREEIDRLIAAEKAPIAGSQTIQAMG